MNERRVLNIGLKAHQYKRTMIEVGISETLRKCSNGVNGLIKTGPCIGRLILTSASCTQLRL